MTHSSNETRSMDTDKRLRAVRMRDMDVDEVLVIERAAFAEPWTKQMFLEELGNRSARLVVFKIDERILGYICFWEVMDEAHLLTVAVHPDHRGQGLGKAMMHHLESMCRRAGLKRIILDVARRNRTARNLYMKCGYRSIGFRKRYYQATADDAIVMDKWLADPQAEVTGDALP